MLCQLLTWQQLRQVPPKRSAVLTLLSNPGFRRPMCSAQIEKQQDNNTCLAYWLSNTVTLLYLLQKNIKPASGGTYTSRLRSAGPAGGR